VGLWSKKEPSTSEDTLASHLRHPRRTQQVRNTDTLVAWALAPCRDNESVRWECLDGRWVAISLGYGATAGQMLVSDSSGRCESLDSYEDALALAKRWRTAALIRF
jgi:hypothetical protein